VRRERESSSSSSSSGRGRLREERMGVFLFFFFFGKREIERGENENGFFPSKRRGSMRVWACREKMEIGRGESESVGSSSYSSSGGGRLSEERTRVFFFFFFFGKREIERGENENGFFPSKRRGSMRVWARREKKEIERRERESVWGQNKRGKD
jgi:hypothetical protein